MINLPSPPFGHIICTGCDASFQLKLFTYSLHRCCFLANTNILFFDFLLNGSNCELNGVKQNLCIKPQKMTKLLCSAHVSLVHHHCKWGQKLKLWKNIMIYHFWSFLLLFLLAIPILRTLINNQCNLYSLCVCVSNDR